MSKKRTARVDGAIKSAWARLAKKHFETAMIETNNCESQNVIGQRSDARMVIVERYLDNAGADATRWHFE